MGVCVDPPAPRSHGPAGPTRPPRLGPAGPTRPPRLGPALALVALVTSPLLLECVPECHMREGARRIQGDRCPVELSSVRPPASGDIYSERVTVRVSMTANDFSRASRIEVLCASEPVVLLPVRERQAKVRCSPQNAAAREGVARVTCLSLPAVCSGQRQEDNQRNPRPVSHGRRGSEKVPSLKPPTCIDTFGVVVYVLRVPVPQWELVYECLRVEAGTVSVSYTTPSHSCGATYTVPDPIPDFHLSVNHSSKSISVTVEAADAVKARWCYRKHGRACVGGGSPPIEIHPSVSPFALLDVPFLLPCVCVQVYYARTDARRHAKCPFRKHSLPDVRDVWRSSRVTLVWSGLSWSSPCSARELNVSASLCWRQHQHLCTPVLNSTLQELFNTSALDVHPQMCVQFSLRGSNHTSCPFSREAPSWEVSYGPGRRSVFLYLTSSVPAKFSAQLCVLTARGCAPAGHVHSAAAENNSGGTTITVPLPLLAEQPCVQVWQSDPALRGRRVLCPDYTHNRFGVYAAAAVGFVVIVSILGVSIKRLANSGASGWLCIREPVLLVCSSEQSAHISAVCSLASILQGELGATVHMALWSRGLQAQPGPGPGVADLGPLPWLYGQWEAVREARGKVLVIWSPEATETYWKWSEERASVERRGGAIEGPSRAQLKRDRTRAKVDEGLKFSGRGMGKRQRQEAEECVKLRDARDWNQREPSAVVGPVFTAALACLEGALHGGKGQGVALVYFQGLCHRRDIPKTFRGLPRYCLPRDLRGLIQELVGTTGRTESAGPGGRRWPRLVSKVLAMWLAQQLTRRLQPPQAGKLEPLRGPP
ncbi:interleukin-17 receptor E isoform 2-T2 [Spinachia spinachia]